MTSSEAEDRYLSLLMAISNGLKWPEYPFTGRLIQSKQPVICLPSLRVTGSRRFRPIMGHEPPPMFNGDKAIFYEYTKKEFSEAEQLVAQIQANALKKAAELLRFAPVEQGNRWAISYEHQMHLAEDILATKRPI